MTKVDREYERKYHEVERNHWWFKSRRNTILQMVSVFPRHIRILDIGCSSGILLQDLVEAGFQKENLYGVDISEKAIENCRQNGFETTYAMDAHNISLDKESFDLIVSSDCLEHLERDTEALQSWNSLLKPGGKAIIFVPAFQFLWSRHDEVNFHFRRYTSKELCNKLKEQNFKLKRSGYWNFLLFLPIAAVRLLGNLFSNKEKSEVNDSEGDLKLPSKIVNQTLITLIDMENKMMQILKFPFGVSTFCVAKKAP